MLEELKSAVVALLEKSFESANSVQMEAILVPMIDSAFKSVGLKAYAEVKLIEQHIQQKALKEKIAEAQAKAASEVPAEAPAASSEAASPESEASQEQEAPKVAE